MFKKKNKNDNIKKENKKSSSFFSNLNTDSTIEYGFAEKNPKSKWAKWSIIAALTTATTVGIAVPWSLSSCSITLNKPYNSNDEMYKYYDPILKKYISVSYKEFADRIMNTQTIKNEIDRWGDVFYHSSLKKYYDEEREAFLKFKAIYKHIHNVDPEISKFGADLTSSFEDIKNSQEKILNENKKAFQRASNFTSNDWLNQWIKELQTNKIYGPQLTSTQSKSIEFLERKAIDYMVNNQISSAALARFKNISISTNSWDEKDLQFCKSTSFDSNKTIEWDDKKTITMLEAVNIWKRYLNESSNLSYKYNASASNDNEKFKIAVFETKSYLVEYRNPVDNEKLLNLINQDFNFGLISSFAISDIKPGEKNSSGFTITKDVLTKFFKINNTSNDGTTSNFVPFSQLFNFKGSNVVVSDSSVKNNPDYIQNTKDKLLIKTFNTSDEKVAASLGSSKLKEITDLINSSTSSSNSNESNSSDTSNTSSSLDLFKLIALTSTNNGIVDKDSKSFLSINKNNPFKIFFDIIFSSSNDPNGNINFTNHQTIKNIWNKLNYSQKPLSADLKTFLVFLNTNINSTDYTYKGTINSNEFNKNLENYLSNLDSNDFDLLGKILNCCFIQNETVKTDYTNSTIFHNQVGYWSLYELSAPSFTNNQIGTYMYVSSEGLNIFSKSINLLTLDQVKKMVKSDLEANINQDGDNKYDIANVFSKLSDDKWIMQHLYSDPTNQQLFKDAIEKYKNNYSNDFDQDIDTILKNFKNDVNLNFESQKAENNLNILNALSSKIKDLFNSKRVYDFATIEDGGQKILVYQTQDKYGTTSLFKGEDQINEILFISINNFLIKRN